MGFPTIEWQSFDAQVGKKTYVLLTPAGNRVELRQIGTSGVYDAADSSYLLLIDYTNYLVLTMNDGTQMLYNAYNLQWRCTQIKDTNGNYLTINYDSVGRLTSITDTLARVITFNYDTYNNLNSITQNWNGTTHYWARFYWDNKITSGTFSGAAEVGTTSTASVPVVSEVRFADESSYRFTYNTYLQASAIRHADSTGYERMTTTFAYGSATNDCPRLDSSSVSASDWTGINGVPSAVTTTYGLEGGAHKLISPDGTIYKEFYGTGWQKGKVTQTEVWSGGTRQKYTTRSYAQDNTSVNYPINPRVHTCDE